MNIGHISLDYPLALAPMDDVTDIPFRLICKKLGADLLYTEFVSCEAIIRDIPQALKKMEILPEEKPVAIQIFGAVSEAMEQATQKIEEFKPDFVDINCGCWVKNFVRRGEGSALLKDLKKLEKVVKSVVSATRLPVTVKTRLGWDMENIVILEAAKIIEQCGAKALTVHCRTRSQAFHEKADWSWLEKIKKTISIPLFGNGDVKSPEDAKAMFDMGCDGVMIGRAAITNPWIFQQIKDSRTSNDSIRTPTFEERIQLCIEHLKLSYAYKGEWKGIVDFRKHYSGYLRGVPRVAQLRAKIMTFMDKDEIIEALLNFLEDYKKNFKKSDFPKAV